MRTNSQSNIPGIFIYVIVCFFALMVAFAAWMVLFNPKTRNIKFSLGANAKVKEVKEISLVAPRNLNGLSKNEILRIRKDIVLKNKDLFREEYEPADNFLRNVDAGLPWLSLEDIFIYGGKRFSPNNPSYLSRLIFNPLELLPVECWESSVLGKNGVKWDNDKLTKEYLTNKEFNFYCKAAQLSWQAKERVIVSRYLIRHLIKQINQFAINPISNEKTVISINTINAFDFGFRRVRFNSFKSKNISVDDTFDKKIVINDRIETNNKICRIEGGCNEYNKDPLKLKKFEITSFPANLDIDLWRGIAKNDSVEPTLNYRIYFY